MEATVSADHGSDRGFPQYIFAVKEDLGGHHFQILGLRKKREKELGVY